MDAGADPMGHIGIYLTAGLGVGQRLTLATIDDRLRRLPLKQSLVLLSELSFKVDQISVPPLDPAAQLEIASHVFPPQFMPAATRLLRQARPRVLAISPQACVLLGIRLLSVSDDEVGEIDPDRLGRQLGALCLALGDHIDAGPMTVESTILEILRLGVFYGKSGHPGWLSLAGRLFFDVLPTLSGDPAWIDPLTRFEAATGISLQRFWAITSVQANAATESDEFFQFPMNIRERPIPDDDLDAWRRLLLVSLPDARRAARADMANPLAWTMSSVWKQPIIDLGQGRGPVLRGSLLQMQTEPSQMFWRVRDAIVSPDVTHRMWSTLYGKAVELLGLDLLHEHVDETEVLDEPAMIDAWRIPAGSKRADAAIVTDDGDLVVIDFVSRQFTQETTATGEFGALARDLRMGVAEKLEQIDVTFRYALSAGAGHKRLFPVVVIAGPFPMFPPLDGVVDAELSGLALEIVGIHPSCRKWMVLDLLGYLTLLTVAAARKVSVPEILDQWQRSTLARNEFREWAIIDGPAKGLPGGGLPDDWRRRVYRYLNLPIDVDDDP